MMAARRLTMVLLVATTWLTSTCCGLSAASTAPVRWGKTYLKRDAGWYASDEAGTVADRLLQFQTDEGGWPKNTDFAAGPKSAEYLRAVRTGREANTIDNDGTTLPMRFLARVANATGEKKYAASFERGLDYLFRAQYANGGWPQFFPLRDHGYYSHITYNDDAMLNVMFLLRDVAAHKPPFEFVDRKRRAQASTAVEKGIDCILRTQIRQGGKLTAWCAQHDEKTLSPAWARNFEPPALSGKESVAITRFLMEIEQPSPAIIAAVKGAVEWFKAVAISGMRYRRGIAADGQRDGWIEPDPAAGPLWARFYELGTNRPIFVGRDKVVHYKFDEIERERRGGYSYFGDWPARLITRDYSAWLAKQ